MDRVVEIAGWTVVAVIGLILWCLWPEVRSILALFLAGSLIYHVFVAAVRLTANRLVGDQLMGLRSDMDVIAERLEHIDHKTHALLTNMLAQRQATNLRDVIQSSVSKRRLAAH